VEKNMKQDDNPLAYSNAKTTYERIISDLNKQLYEAYKRVDQLNQELQHQREKNGKE
jgi:prefoldin subunit 5